MMLMGGDFVATQKITFTIDAKVIDRVRELATKEKRSTSQMATVLLEEALDNREK